MLNSNVPQQPTAPTNGANVLSALENAYNAINELIKRSESLRDRLSPVLQPTGPDSPGVVATPPPHYSSVATGLFELTGRVAVLDRIIVNLHERLDV